MKISKLEYHVCFVKTKKLQSLNLLNGFAALTYIKEAKLLKNNYLRDK